MFKDGIKSVSKMVFIFCLVFVLFDLVGFVEVMKSTEDANRHTTTTTSSVSHMHRFSFLFF